jgi:type II secretory pathway pseudopilin PulG
MFGGQGSGSQIGHGGAAGAPSPEALAAQQQAQMMAAQAAQQAYMQALSQHGGSVMSGEGGGGGSPPPMPPHSMGMMPFNPYMSMYGAPSMTGFSGFMPPMGSDVGQQMTASPSPNLRNRSQERLNSNNSPLRR